jgi:hypothetical protein
MATCTICSKKIVLTPSASERAKKSNEPTGYFTALFTEHSKCSNQKRSAASIALIKQIASQNKAKRVAYAITV